MNIITIPNIIEIHDGMSTKPIMLPKIIAVYVHIIKDNIFLGIFMAKRHKVTPNKRPITFINPIISNLYKNMSISIQILSL